MNVSSSVSFFIAIGFSDDILSASFPWDDVPKVYTLTILIFLPIFVCRRLPYRYKFREFGLPQFLLHGVSFLLHVVNDAVQLAVHVEVQSYSF